MKIFTCREMSGPCEEVAEGELAMDVAMKNHAHVMSTTDDAHRQMRDQMTNPSEEDQKKWWDWFNGEWEKKPSVC